MGHPELCIYRPFSITDGISSRTNQIYSSIFVPNGDKKSKLCRPMFSINLPTQGCTLIDLVLAAWVGGRFHISAISS
jgi:hypothetical protein